MPDESPEDRLEAALERIAAAIADRTRRTAAAADPSQPAGAQEGPDQETLADEVAARLDRVIDTLREALRQ